jgi:hypothetical protein
MFVCVYRKAKDFGLAEIPREEKKQAEIWKQMF